jgi:NAD(P)-dependent dehydrogenase (short-subunit alcohol dehydrogenase family)
MSNVNVTVVIGAGSIGQAIARRVSAGKHVLLADLREENAKAAADVMSNAGFDVSTTSVDISSRASIHDLVLAATKVGDVTGVIHAAGVSPSQASPATISGSTCTGPRFCSRSSGTSSRAEGRAW